MKIKIGMGSCGIAAGATAVKETIVKLLDKRPVKDISLIDVGCMGMCYAEPLLEIDDENGETIYGYVDEISATKIFESHVVNGVAVPELIVKSDQISTENDSFFNNQKRFVLSRCGVIDPCSIDDALLHGAYKGLIKALTMSPEGIIDKLILSRLRGRGGAGFPTGLKWKYAKESPGKEKYIICNADEGDPGAFMDRSILEGDPHAVIEGLIIGGYAIGANSGIIYARAEYPLAIERIKKAISDATAHGYLGDNILSSTFSFTITVKEGAGAFVCGEETALMHSVEGKRGMPTMRPPFPAEKGLFGKPTNINNVETLANIGRIISDGVEEFIKLGTEKSHGTKVFALAGKIKRGGLIEVPIGTSIREIIYDIGGGSSSDKEIKAVQLGGPSGGCIPKELFDTAIDYETIAETGAIMGSGGMVVMDEETCMVDIARFFESFTQNESCGKCTFCRIGTKRSLEILERITHGMGKEEDIDKLLLLSEEIKKNSLCGLGQTAPNPVLTTLQYFLDEYKAHIFEHRCPAGQCSALIRYEIDEKQCRGCTICAKKCPAKAISGNRKEPHRIDQNLCIKCGACMEACPFKAITKE